MPQNIKITSTDVINFINVDYYEVDGRKISVYTNGNKYPHEIVFSSSDEATERFNKLNRYLKPKDLTEPESARDMIDDVSIDKLFYEFWNMYEKRGNKKTARLRFGKLSAKERTELFKITPLYIKSRPEIKYRKHAERYINDREWENINDIERRLDDMEDKTKLKSW